MKSRLLRGGWAALVLLGVPSCIIDDDKCDAHQVELNEGHYSLCVCEPNAVIGAKGYGCTPCGENEEPKDNLCACKAGYAKPNADSPCQKSEIGGACATGAECPTGFPYCADVGSGAGYCTLDTCTQNADCPSGYSCESGDSLRYCRKLPTGIGVACETSDDCAGFDAKLCNSLTTHTCVLTGCAAAEVGCPSEWTCCDFSALVSMPLSVCAPPEMLVEGSCPMGGMAVTP